MVTFLCLDAGTRPGMVFFGMSGIQNQHYLFVTNLPKLCFLKNGNKSAIKASHTHPPPPSAHLAAFCSSQHDCDFVMLSCQREQKSPRSSSSRSPQEVYPFSKLHFHERGVLNKRLISEHVCFIMLGGRTSSHA